MRQLLLALLLFTVFEIRANVIEAPIIEADFAQNPSHIKWRVIETEHFDIIFPQEIEDEAQRVAHLLEKAYPYVTRSLEVEPPRIPLVLQNQSTNSNGFVTLAPRRSEWYVTPAVDPELTNTEWLKTLSIHEFRHVVQFQKTRQGFNIALEILLGEIGQALGLGLTLPPWFLEGDAVGVETALTKGGRGRLPLFERDLRTLLLSDKKWNYDKAHLGSYADYVPNHYVYGYFYTSWLRNEYGDLFLSKLADESAKNSWNPLNFYLTTESLTGKSFESFYRSVMGDLIREWKDRLSKLSPTPYKVITSEKRFGWTNYLYPQLTEDGKVLALKRGLSYIPQFVLIHGKEEKVLFYPSSLQNEYPFKLRNGRLAFFENELDPRWGYRDYSRLKVYDLKKEKFVLDLRKTKGRLAVLDHVGSRVLYVDWKSEQRQDIVVADLKGRELLRFPFPKDEVITSMDWIDDENVVLVIKDRDDQKSMIQLNLATWNRDDLIPKSVNNIGFVTVDEGSILFESPESGIDNIWLYTSQGPKQITSSLFGAYAPTLVGDKLYYNDYTVEGMNIVSKNHSFDEEQKSENSFYPIYEKFAQSENYSEFNSELLTQKTYTSQKYSQPKNAFNLHSWIILAPPLSNTVTLIGQSRDILNNFTLTAGAEYHLGERAAQVFVSSLWSHYYPLFDLRAGYGGRRQEFSTPQGEVEHRWEEGTFEAGVQIPWKYLQGRFSHQFTIRAFSKIIKVLNKRVQDRSEINDGALHSPGAEIHYSVLSRMSRRDMNPHLGFIFALKAEEGQDISGTDQEGSLHHVDSRLYLPGLWHHHSFYHQLAYERQRDDLYQYSSLVAYPRGTRSVFLQEFTKYSGNYLLPLFYPDYNLSRYIYFKRISLNLFYDELNGRLRGIPYHAASVGWETIFEMHFLRIFLPFSVGLRGSYVLDGLEKSNNYELFLTTVLGTF